MKFFVDQAFKIQDKTRFQGNFMIKKYCFCIPDSLETNSAKDLEYLLNKNLQIGRNSFDLLQKHHSRGLHFLYNIYIHSQFKDTQSESRRNNTFTDGKTFAIQILLLLLFGDTTIKIARNSFPFF